MPRATAHRHRPNSVRTFTGASLLDSGLLIFGRLQEILRTRIDAQSVDLDAIDAPLRRWLKRNTDAPFCALEGRVPPLAPESRIAKIGLGEHIAYWTGHRFFREKNPQISDTGINRAQMPAKKDRCAE